ncbi:hypothetical protein, partial [Mucilaginibacter arboris]|uniref:hypothetical protein n=1 Tax=Mucilaginibacter arboris TaxID=2682090 RepID=UPI0018DE9DBD
KIELKYKKSDEIIELILSVELNSLFNKILKKISQLEDLFFHKELKIIIKKGTLYELSFNNLDIGKLISKVKEDDLYYANYFDPTQEERTYSFITLDINLKEFKNLSNKFSVSDNNKCSIQRIWL